jgi:Mrp family chromosome partitioning ATPase
LPAIGPRHAIALKRLGIRVGLIDADIYGPSLAISRACEGP